MNLTQSLRNEGYDYIDSLVRNHKLGQLWLRKNFNEPELYFERVTDAFSSDVALEEILNPALNVDFSQQNTFKFNIGMTVLEETLTSIGMSQLGLSTKLSTGKSVSIKFDHTLSKEYALGNMEHFFQEADFVRPSPSLLRNANKNFILFVSGLIEAENLIAEINTDKEISAEVVAELTEAAKGTASFDLTKKTILKMTSDPGQRFPVAVKAHRLFYDKGVFGQMKLISNVLETF